MQSKLQFLFFYPFVRKSLEVPVGFYARKDWFNISGPLFAIYITYFAEQIFPYPLFVPFQSVVPFCDPIALSLKTGSTQRTALEVLCLTCATGL